MGLGTHQRSLLLGHSPVKTGTTALSSSPLQERLDIEPSSMELSLTLLEHCQGYGPYLNPAAAPSEGRRQPVRRP